MVTVPSLNPAIEALTPEPLAGAAVFPTVGQGVPIRRGMLAAFSSPGLPIAALGLPLVVQLPEFYANVIGVKLAAVGMAFMIVRILDLGLDPILGVLMDRTRTPFGRFRPWMVLGAPLLMFASFMIFIAPRPGAGAGYLVGWLLPLYAAFSIITLSHAAWASVLAPEYNQRSRIYAWMQNSAVIGMALVLLLPPIMAKWRPGEHGAGVHAMGWFIIILTPITMALLVWRTPEPALAASRSSGSPGVLLKRFMVLARRPTVTRILIADVCLAMAPGITGAIFIFYFREARGMTTAQANLLLLAYFVGALCGAPIWTRLARRIGKHRSLCAAAIYYAGLLSLSLIYPKGQLAVFLPSMFLTGLAFSAGTVMLRSMLADAADEARLSDGADSTAMLYAMITSTQKVASALSIGAAFTILGAIGFVAKAGAHNTAEAIRGLSLLFVVGPTVFLLLAVTALWNYRLDEARHQAIRTALEVRDAG